MSEAPTGDGSSRLHRCIRDLAALNALPSMCIGRSPDEALDTSSTRSRPRSAAISSI
jgi:hypothetical protein